MPTPSPALPLTTRRLMLLWLSWTVGSAIANTAAWIIVFEFNPSEGLLLSTELLTEVGLDLNYAIQGAYYGLAQWLVLRYFIRGPRWFPWVLITILGAVIGSYVFYGFWWDLITVHGYQDRISAQIAFPLHYGLVVGVLQAPFLNFRFGLARWWLWPIPSVISVFLGSFVWEAVAADNSLRPIGLAAEGLTVGLITGLALVLLLRGTPIPQVKEEAKAS